MDVIDLNQSTYTVKLSSHELHMAIEHLKCSFSPTKQEPSSFHTIVGWGLGGGLLAGQNLQLRCS